MQKISILVLALLGLACAAWDGDEPSLTVARNAEMVITLDELDEWLKETLFQERTEGGEASQVYEARARALDSLIELRVIAGEAERRNTTVEALLDSAGGDVSETEIQAFFDENQEKIGEQTLEAIAPAIRTHLEQQNRRTAIASWIEAADVQIQLAPPRFEVGAVGPARGASEPTVTIIEFSDFQCPFCRRAGPILDELLERYPQDVRVVYRHLPLASIHPRALPAAQASTCAEDQGLFWEFHDALFAGPAALADEDLRQLAEQVDAEMAVYDECVASGANVDRVEADVAAARAVGITGTPAFFVNGVLLRGAQPVAAFERIIEHDLAVANAAP